MEINFNKKLYKKKAISGAIRDYRHLANFKITSTENNHEVKLSNIDKEVKNIIKQEFCNYVLSLMRS